MNSFKSLVSVGIPTFNRPEGLNEALECISNQSYSNLEIIVADNASTHPDVIKILKKWKEKDKRIRYIRHPSNLGPLRNFNSVLMESTGEYFMWAADDDLRETWFIARCLEKFAEYPTISAVTTEVQFICEGKHMPCFPQGAAFYEGSFKIRTGLSAALYTLDFNYDNLIYALFRKTALISDKRCVWIESAQGAGNEIPAILYSGMKGGFLVLQEFGFYKKSTTSSYLQAKWEVCGGRSPPTSKVSSVKVALATYSYHSKALKEIVSSIQILPLTKFDKKLLAIKAWMNLHMHFLWMLMGKKPLNKKSIN